MSTINSVTGPYERQTYVGDKTDKKGPPTGASGKPDVSGEDKVSLSAGSKDMQTAKAAVLASPVENSDATQSGQRAEKVLRLQNAVETGQYVVDADKVAEKMIGAIVDRFI